MNNNTTPPPSPDVSDGGNNHDNRGRFALGNKLGRGSPLAGRAAKIRAILLKSLTAADAKAIATKLIAQAKAGDLAATKELLDRTIGKASQSEVVERLDRLESLLAEIKQEPKHECQ